MSDEYSIHGHFLEGKSDADTYHWKMNQLREREAADEEARATSVRAALEREVVGALRSCIDAHGPITKEWLGSAGKRVVSALEAGSAVRILSLSENGE